MDKLVKEYLDFERGIDPLDAMNAGKNNLNFSSPKEFALYLYKNFKELTGLTPSKEIVGSNEIGRPFYKNEDTWDNIKKYFKNCKHSIRNYKISDPGLRDWCEINRELCKLLRNGINESANFERNLDPLDAMNIGKKVQIIKWLNEMKIEDYTINNDYTIDVNSFVNLRDQNIVKFPNFIQFNKINHSFSIALNGLTTLKGCPKWVEGSFWCDKNNLTSLEYMPEYIGGEVCIVSNNPGYFTYQDILKYCPKLKPNQFKYRS